MKIIKNDLFAIENLADILILKNEYQDSINFLADLQLKFLKENNIKAVNEVNKNIQHFQHQCKLLRQSIKFYKSEIHLQN
jgi:hypothetical protein